MDNLIIHAPQDAHVINVTGIMDKMGHCATRFDRLIFSRLSILREYVASRRKIIVLLSSGLFQDSLASIAVSYAIEHPEKVILITFGWNYLPIWFPSEMRYRILHLEDGYQPSGPLKGFKFKLEDGEFHDWPAIERALFAEALKD